MSKSFILVLLGFVFCVTAMTPRPVAAIQLGANCQSVFRDFKNWSANPKVFAYAHLSMRMYVCRYGRGEATVLEECNRRAAKYGLKCRVYARSAPGGGVKVVWDEEDPKAINSAFLAGRPDTALCRTAAANGNAEWWKGPLRSRYVAELKRRDITKEDCDAILNPPPKVKAQVAAVASTTDPPMTVETSKASKALRKKHKHAVAVIIGNRKYQDGVPEVLFAHNDANAMRTYLIHSLGYRPGNVIDLRDATQSKLIGVFGSKDNHKGKLYSYVRPGKSDVTIFYSGHGAPGLNDRKGYLLPVDADPNLIELNGYPIDLLLGNVAKINTRSTTVYMDACFSGDSPKGMIVRAVSGISVTPRLPAASQSMTVITAAQGSQFASWDEEAKLGLFTGHLLKALSGTADEEDYGNGDGKLTLAEVQAYLDDEMTYQARRRYNRDQVVSVQGTPETVLAGE